MNSFWCDVLLACCLSVSLHQFLQPPNSPSTHPYHFFTFKSSYYILVKLNPIFFLLKVPASIGCHTAVLFYFTVAHALFNKNLKWKLYILSSSAVNPVILKIRSLVSNIIISLFGMQILCLTPDLLNQKFQGMGPAIGILTNSWSNSDGR